MRAVPDTDARRERAVVHSICERRYSLVARRGAYPFTRADVHVEHRIATPLECSIVLVSIGMHDGVPTSAHASRSLRVVSWDDI